MLTRPLMLPPAPSALRSCCSLTDCAVGLTEPSGLRCALAGAADITSSASANAPTIKRACARNPAMPNLLRYPSCRFERRDAPSVRLYEAIVSRYAVCHPQAPELYRRFVTRSLKI